MQCVDFEARVQEILDERARPEQDLSLREHAGNCPACRELLSGLAAAIEGLELCAAPACGSDLSARVVAELSRPITTIRFPVHRRRALATAAAVLVLAGPRGWWLSQRATPTAQLANEQHQPAVDQRMTQISPEAPLAVAHQEIEPRDQLVTALLALPSLSGMPLAEPGERAEASPQLRWGQDVSDGLAPLTRSTAGAFDTLWQAIPWSAEDTRS